MTMTDPDHTVDQPGEDEPRPAVEAVATVPLDEPAGTDLVPHVPGMIPGTALPIIPPHEEMRGLAAMAVTLAAAQAVPAALQNRPNDVFQVLLTARDLGVAVTTAMREFHVIDGRVTLSPKAKLAMVNERGRRDGWAVWPDPENDAITATWYATRVDRPGLTFHSTFTFEMATTAKLTHKDNWTKYPQRMMSWRALGYLLDDVFPEVATGIYSPDELGAMTDEEGHVIDVASTDPLPGTRGMAPRPSDATSTLADEAVRFEIVCRIGALPDESRDALRERWKANSTLRRLTPAELTVTGARAATAILKGVEDEARRAGWAMDEAHAAYGRLLDELADTPAGEPATTGDDAPPEQAPEFTELETTIIAEVKAMNLPVVDAALTELREPTTGSGQERRGRLAAAKLAAAHG